MAQSIVNIRMNTELKKNMEEVCQELGMNMTTAFTLFAKKMTRERRIPFELPINSGDVLSFFPLSTPELIIINSVLVHCISYETEIIVPEGVTSIGERAFRKHPTLSKIHFPDSLLSIEDSAFEDCSCLETICIPDSVNFIGPRAFAGCSRLTQANIPPSASIGLHAFQNCTGLADDLGLIIVNNGLLEYCGSGGQVHIPDGVTFIGEEAFHGCDTIEKVWLPDSVSYIERFAFRNCINLTLVNPETPPEVLEEVGGFFIEIIEEGAFQGCTSLRDCYHLLSDFTDVAPDVFEGCTSLETWWLPKNTTLWCLSGSCFSNCPAMADKDGFVVISGTLFGYYGKGGNIRIPDRVDIIGENVFRNNTSITAVHFHDKVSRIKSSAFENCINLTQVHLPARSVYIESKAFKGCFGLANQEGLVIVKNTVFDHKRSFLTEEVDIPKGVWDISDEAFLHDPYLKCVNIPKSVFSIGARAFSYCSSLSRISLPDSLKHVGDRAFWGCSNLSIPRLPDSVKYLGEDIFWGCLEPSFLDWYDEDAEMPF